MVITLPTNFWHDTERSKYVNLVLASKTHVKAFVFKTQALVRTPVNPEDIIEITSSKCNICGKEIHGDDAVRNEDGYAHHECYLRHNA